MLQVGVCDAETEGDGAHAFLRPANDIPGYVVSTWNVNPMSTETIGETAFANPD